ncbi:hybrid sensor histidine kinase/response regulator [Roseomonas genomospecies 6]|uniref:histidine kinase n=1 Tax=Roseomonas genomospecies 6 TaxID=214106 RepID=A0A9W7NIB3_9PROT|nr:hybrid sensor histidine kinase/response regulator [Roseomonas genomospecies 6]KAA0679496.1 hypothetical protein DS843_16285 [Roseomonas genomospecies 6]
MIVDGLPVAARTLWIRGGLVAAAVMAVLAAAAAVWLWLDLARALAAGERSARSLVRVLEEQTARSFQAVDLTLTGIIDTLTLKHDFSEHDLAFADTLRERLRSLPHVRALFVIGADGFITQDTDHPKTPRVTLADRDYFIAHAKDPSASLLIGKPLISRSLDDWFVSVSRRIDQSNGSFGGIAVAAVEPRYFERFYQALGLEERDSIALFRHDGILIARFPQHDAVVGKDFSSLELFTVRLPGNAEGTYHAPSMIDRTPRVVSYRSVPEFPLVVAVTLNKDTLLAGWWRNVTATVAAGFLVAGLLALLVALWVRRRVEREQAVQQQIQAQKLEALGRMTGGVAHDFNNLMAVVSSCLMLVRRRVDTEEVKHLTETALGAVERGTKLTQQMLAFARRQDLTIVEADVNEMLASLQELLRNAAGRQVEVIFDLGSDVPLCRTDRTQFDTALLNLVVNARDAMPSGGTIRIATARCTEGDVRRTGTLKPVPHACVTIADTGQGMPPDVLRRALEPFFTTKGDKGTGLGLSQVYGFVRQNGGDMKVESEVGVGTTFHLLFPAVERGSIPASSRTKTPGDEDRSRASPTSA